MRLALGTAQFGLSYGVANAGGRVPKDEVARILDLAASNNIDLLDTAIAYGSSEKILGEIGVNRFRVVTKLPGLPDKLQGGQALARWVRNEVLASRERLGAETLHGLLLHKPADLLTRHGPQLCDELSGLMQKHHVNKVGYSIYDPATLDELYPILKPGIVQVPFNVYDQRIKTSGWLQRLNEAKVEVHARSAFLQGLLLMSPSERPSYFDKWKSSLLEWDAIHEKSGRTRLAIALHFAMQEPAITKVLVGVDSTEQLQQITLEVAAPLSAVPSSITGAELELIEPFRWRL